MLLFARIVFGLNAIYLTTFGLICLLGPSVAITMFGGSVADQQSTLLMIAFRIIGIGLVPVGVMSALVAGDPENTPMLRALLGLAAVLSVICWGVVIGRHDLRATQLASVVLNICMQVMVIVAVVFYHPRAKTAKITINRRSIAA
jgi:hypothetical protein